MATKKATTVSTDTSIEIQQIKTGRVGMCIRGTTPLIFNSMNAKVMRDLLLPKGKKTTAEKASTLKHDPRAEFERSMNRYDGNSNPTRLFLPSTAFKKAAMTAALDLPGAKKSEIGRLLYINGAQISIWGVPKLFMSVVRSADMNRTPDVRTRAILDEWCCVLDVSFNLVKLRTQPVINLFSAAGITSGVGDFRQEKGAGSFGQFEICGSEDADFLRVQKSGGMLVQGAAIKAAAPYDGETAELLTWFDSEVKRRGAA